MEMRYSLPSKEAFLGPYSSDCLLTLTQNSNPKEQSSSQRSLIYIYLLTCNSSLLQRHLTDTCKYSRPMKSDLSLTWLQATGLTIVAFTETSSRGNSRTIMESDLVVSALYRSQCCATQSSVHAKQISGSATAMQEP